MMRWIVILIVLGFLTGCPSKQQAKSPEGKTPDAPMSIPVSKQTSDPPLVKVSDLLSAPELVGKTVRVTGRCMGYGSEHVLGAQPRTRSDWALEDDSAAVYVTGPYPPGCSGTQPGEGPVLVTGIVAVDTLTSYADGAKSPRYFIVATEAPK